jgi:hypothetical protein
VGSVNLELMASVLMTRSRAKVGSSAPQTLQIASMTVIVGTNCGLPDNASEIVVGPQLARLANARRLPTPAVSVSSRSTCASRPAGESGS